MPFILTVKETGNKRARYHYQVKDEAGTVISERHSNRKYVACTKNGSHYFSRLDLINKGDHAKIVKWLQSKGMTPPEIAYLQNNDTQSKIN